MIIILTLEALGATRLSVILVHTWSEIKDAERSINHVLQSTNLVAKHV